VRLKASFVVPDSWTIEEKAVLRALKKYGALVADNGGFFSVSVCPDDRFAANAFDHLSTIGISNFEVVQTTGPTEGPRSPGAPAVDAGPDQFLEWPTSISLGGSVNDPSGRASVLWKIYSGPAGALFANPNQPATNVTINGPGTYTFLLSADDGVHAIAYDAVVVRVTGHNALANLSTRVQVDAAILATLAPGAYTAILRGNGNASGIGLVEVYDLQPSASSKLANLSTRGLVGTGQNVMIGGTIVAGPDSARVVFRALGPSLAGVGIPNALSDPKLELFDGNGTKISSNNNWKDSQQVAITNSGLAP